MDLSFVWKRRLAVGGGIWQPEAMADMARHGFTHIVNLQAEFDNTSLAAAAGVQALWNPVEDDMTPKPPDFFERSVRFALAALRQPQAKVYVHCAAGVHRAPMTGAAILCALGASLDEAVSAVAKRRVGADFPEVYLASLRRWLDTRSPIA